MSYPHIKGKVDPNGQVPLSCNAGITMSDYPAQMTSTKEIVEILLRHGPGVTFCKEDWADAYSGLMANWKRAVIMNVFQSMCMSGLRTSAYKWWNGEACTLWTGISECDDKQGMSCCRSLTFGCGSSPGIYHIVSSVVKVAALAREELQLRDTFQVLDDCGHIGIWADTKAFRERDTSRGG